MGVNTEFIVALESFVCHLYGYKDTDINKIRKTTFYKKFAKVHSQSTFYLHILRYNYALRIWKCSLLNEVEYPSTMENGWMENREIVSVDDVFPDNIMDILTKESWNSN